MNETDHLKENLTPLGIYIHIPFCVRKCSYCDFLSAPAGQEVRDRYVSRLLQEIDQFEGGEEYRADSLFLGGGTPSLLDGGAVDAILREVRLRFPHRSPDWEVTVECNPGTLTREKLKAYRECGVNRLSLGLQSADNRELAFLGRIHTWEEFLDNFTQARELGFSNINVDLMSALPGQTVESWRHTLTRVLEQRPEHISAYSLIIEEGTPFYEWYGEGRKGREEEALQETEDGGKAGRSRAQREDGRQKKIPPLPDEEAEREMYYETERILRAAGMRRYEISNYSLPGFESRHNRGYWERKPYAGFGLGASSQLGKLRYKNTDSLEEYLAGDFSKREAAVLTRDNEIEETMYLGLRMMKGVDLEQFRKTFGTDALTIYRQPLARLKNLGLVEIRQGALCLTPRGIDVSNQVLAEFLLD